MRQESSPPNPTTSDAVLTLLRGGPVLLYDGECGVCNRSVQWILSHERTESLRFAALQSEWGRELRAQAKVSTELDSVLWIEEQDGAVVFQTYSGAVLRVLRYVGGPWRAMGAMMALVPRPLRDLAYRLFAEHRLQVAAPACLVPSTATRARFLDT